MSNPVASDQELRTTVIYALEQLRPIAHLIPDSGTAPSLAEARERIDRAWDALDAAIRGAQK